MQSDHKNLTSESGVSVSSPGLEGSEVEALKKDHQDFLAFKTEVFSDVSVSCFDIACLDFECA